MKSRKIYIGNCAGFTLIEIMVSMAILAVLAGFGLFIAVDQYKSYALSSERNTVVSMLQKARSRALNNIGETRHGLALGPIGKPTSYVAFRGATYATRNADYDEEVPMSPAVAITGVKEFVFRQLSGDGLNAGTATISTTEKSLTIDVNNEGRINW